jgi:phage shock protein A
VIFKKFWAAFKAQVNKVANFFWEADPIAQMRLEYDQSVEQLKEGRKGLEMYRGLVEKVGRQVREGEKHCQKLESQAKAYLKAGDRETAAKFALELQKAKADLAENRGQLEMHEQAYQNNLTKIQHANKKLIEVRDRIQKYDAELKMSRAEAEMAKLATSFKFDMTTDFGQIEAVIQDKIALNRGKARVAADLSGEGIEEVRRDQAVEKAMADQALRQFEVDMGLVTPATAGVEETAKELGPAKTKAQEKA